MKPQIIFGILCIGAVLAYIRTASRQAKFEAGPASTATAKAGVPTADSPYLRVFLTKTGVLSVEGKEASLPQLAASLDQLASKRGLVLYSREAPEEFEPHPLAKSVIDLFVQRRLPIRLCRSADFSDAIGPDGKLKVGD